MGKLSRKKDKAAGPGTDKGQQKITGFFQTPKPFTAVQSNPPNQSTNRELTSNQTTNTELTDSSSTNRELTSTNRKSSSNQPTNGESTGYKMGCGTGRPSVLGGGTVKPTSPEANMSPVLKPSPAKQNNDRPNSSDKTTMPPSAKGGTILPPQPHNTSCKDGQDLDLIIENTPEATRRTYKLKKTGQAKRLLTDEHSTMEHKYPKAGRKRPRLEEKLLTAEPKHLTAEPKHLTEEPNHLTAEPKHMTAEPKHLTAERKKPRLEEKENASILYEYANIDLSGPSIVGQHNSVCNQENPECSTGEQEPWDLDWAEGDNFGEEDDTVNDDPPLAAQYNRHKILSIDDSVANQLILILQDAFHPSVSRKAIIKESWLQTVFNEDDILHIEGKFINDVIIISDKEGSVVVNPDLLVSGTAVVSALFCLRKAVLAERFKGGGGGSKVMLLGTLVHELLQSVLQRREYSRERIAAILESILSSSSTVQELSYLGLTELEMRKEIQPFLQHIQFFVQKYIRGEKVAAPEPSTPDKPKRGMERPQWKGQIEKIVDIEENIWSPRLGIKGKIDLTVGVQGSKRVLPLELKTGKPSFSPEHSGQVMLYSMMSRDRRTAPGSGLLLYLRSSNMVEVPCGRNEERGLIQLRNQLVAYLSVASKYEEGKVSQMILPEPIDFENACTKCDFLNICAIYQHTQGCVPAAPHPMSRLVPASLGHLEARHLAWFNHWSDTLRLEAGEAKASLRTLWCESPRDREAAGSCLQALSLHSVVENNKHKFKRSASSLPQIFQTGEVVVLSSSTELALSQGAIVGADKEEIIVELDRDLRLQVGWREKMYILDRHIYQGSMGSNFVAIGKLMADTPQAGSLRRIIIDREPARFLPGLGRDVAISARTVIKSLNKIQQKAIFRCMMTENYSLIRGMPGSGKSTTIVGIIRLLAKLGQSVLLVAYTNSAVDTVLCKLREFETKFLRLGRKTRVRPELQEFTAEHVSRDVTSCDQLSELYGSYNIIATTCLATDHAAIVNRTFDWCIIDEASQALLPSVIHPILHSRKFILVGDPAQLPPVVQNHHARKLGLSQSLFDLLDCPSATLDLNIQYRMNQTIADLANHLTYKGKLECADISVAERKLNLTLSTSTRPWIKASLESSLEKSTVFLDTGDVAREEGLSWGVRNVGEGAILLILITEALRGGLEEGQVAVIAPYTAQVKYLQLLMQERGLKKVEVGTVDQFQGRDNELVIYSCTRSFSNSDSSVKAGYILGDERRLNVAITRARSKLVLVGSLDTLVREYQPFRDMKPFFEKGRIIKLKSEDFQDGTAEER